MVEDEGVEETERKNSGQAARVVSSCRLTGGVIVVLFLCTLCTPRLLLLADKNQPWAMFVDFDWSVGELSTIRGSILKKARLDARLGVAATSVALPANQGCGGIELIGLGMSEPSVFRQLPMLSHDGRYARLVHESRVPSTSELMYFYYLPSATANASR